MKQSVCFFSSLLFRDLLFETPQIPTHGEGSADTAQRVSREVSGKEQAVSPSEWMQVCLWVCVWYSSNGIPVEDTSCADQVVVVVVVFGGWGHAEAVCADSPEAVGTQGGGGGVGVE